MRKGRLAVRELKVVREKIDAQLDRYDLTPEANWTARTRVKWLELWTARKAALPIMTLRKLKSICGLRPNAQLGALTATGNPAHAGARSFSEPTKSTRNSGVT